VPFVPIPKKSGINRSENHKTHRERKTRSTQSEFRINRDYKMRIGGDRDFSRASLQLAIPNAFAWIVSFISHHLL